MRAKMLEWLLSGACNHIAGQRVDFTDHTAKELQSVLDDEEKLERIEEYFNALMHSGEDGEPLGWKVVDKIFNQTVKRYPALTGTLKVYVYS